MALPVESIWKSRMMGDCQVRFRERLGVKLPGLLDLSKQILSLHYGWFTYL